VKILLVHERYQIPGGEDAMFAAERDLLARAGHEVICHELHHEGIGRSLVNRLSTAASAVWSVSSFIALRRLIRRTSPALVHFHNTFPLISPSGYRAAQLEGAAVVQTLHNYRLVCPGGLLQRAGAPCEDCVGRSLLPAVRHSCYRNSPLASAAVAGMLGANRLIGSYRREVNRYIALTEFARELFIRGGLPAARLVVRPNGLTDDPGPGRGEGGFALYVGRLSPEKGVTALVDAWIRSASLPLIIVGDGPLRARLEARSTGAAGRISFAGQLPHSQVVELMQAATLVILPSECYEGLPVTLMEALACGAPLAASRLGALAELVTDGVNGVHFPAGDPAAMAGAIAGLLARPAELAAIRRRNRALFEARYSSATALQSLERVYAEALRDRAGAPSSGSRRATRQPLAQEESHEDRA